MRSLNSVEYWQELNKKSHEQPQIIFKHSSACPISLTAFESLKEAEEAGATPQDIHMLVVQVSPELSAQIEEESGIKHESPGKTFIVFWSSGTKKSIPASVEFARVGVFTSLIFDIFIII